MDKPVVMSLRYQSSRRTPCRLHAPNRAAPLRILDAAVAHEEQAGTSCTALDHGSDRYERRGCQSNWGRYSGLFKLEHVSGAWLGDMLARLQVRYPEVQVVFADSRKFAEEWTYRFLAAALADSIGSDVAR